MVDKLTRKLMKALDGDEGLNMLMERINKIIKESFDGSAVINKVEIEERINGKFEIRFDGEMLK